MYPTVHCVFDTATSASLNALVPTERGKPQSNLAGLALFLLGETIEQHTVYDPVEDVLASLQIYLKHLPWEVRLFIKLCFVCISSLLLYTLKK